ncbi:MAG: sulfatase-like hydrolase/transferase [Eubacteriales bacterium]
MKKTNVLILLSDQQRFDTIAQAGFPHMHTPNLDRLSLDSELCVCGYSGNPVCMPARHDLITGFPARVHGYYGNAESRRIKNYKTPTIGRIFSDANYRTAAIGKMHFSPAREHHGFSEIRLMEELPKVRQNDEYLMHLKENGLGEIQNPHGVRPHIYHIPQQSQQSNDMHGTTWVADETISWLNENEGNPFMIMCGFIQPHPPWNIPKEWNDVYENVDVPKSIPKSRLPFEEEGKSKWFGDKDSQEQKDKIRKAYYTAVSMVDHSVGRIIAHLKEIGEYDNTLIIYTSDHGEMLQDKGYYSKELPYDSAVRVPFIVKYPKSYDKKGIRTDFVDLLDILPTCLDVCDIPCQPYEQPLFGKSLLIPDKKRFQFAATGELPLRWVMCCDDKYKYIYHYMGGYEELYEMGKPEINNLAAGEISKELKKRMTTLKSAAIAYERKWGIEGGIVDGTFIQVEAECVNPSVRGKFHFWSNMQMQKFYEASTYDRGEALEKEMRHALSNEKFSGVKLEKVFTEQEWVDQFNECFKEYTDSDEEAKFLK